MFICTFRYKPEHVRCCLCTEYDPKVGCTAQGCPWLSERIEAGVVGYHAAEKVGRSFYDHVQPLDERLDAAEPSLEELMLGAIELAARDADRTILMQKIRICLSTTKFRRM